MSHSGARTAQYILKKVVHAFFPDICIVAMDALLLYDSMKVTEERLIEDLNINKEIAQSALYSLKESKLADSHRSGDETFWFVNLKSAMNAVKYKMYEIGQALKQPTKDKESVDYVCLDCNKEFWGMEGLSQLMARGNPLRCNQCSSVQIGTKTRNTEDATNYEALRECLGEINRLVASMGNIQVANSDNYGLKSKSNRSGGSGGSGRAWWNSKDNLSDVGDIKVSVVLEGVPDHHFVRGITQIVPDEDRSRKIVQTETPPWILNSHQRAAMKHTRPQEENMELSMAVLREENKRALVEYRKHYLNFLAREEDYFLTCSEEDSDLEMEDVDYMSLDDEDSYIPFGSDRISVCEVTDEIIALFSDKEFLEYYHTICRLLPHPL